jgi:acyl-CoA thioesterase FadM
MTFFFEIHQQKEGTATPPLVTAELVYVNADPRMKPAPLPEELREKVRRYERIEPRS